MGIDISFYKKKSPWCEPEETICMSCQRLFSGKNKKNINLSYAEFAQRVVKVKDSGIWNLLYLL